MSHAHASTLPATATKQHARSQTPSTGALLDGLRTSTSPTALPQPVAARNAGLIDAWHVWLAAQHDVREARAMADLMSSNQRRLEDNIPLFKYALQDDPRWQTGRYTIADGLRGETAVVMMGAAPLMFWTRTHMLLEATDALEQLLVHSDIGEDLPASLFQPPAPACFIRFGKTFQQGVVPATDQPTSSARQLTGIYVFDARHNGARAIDIVCIFFVPDAGLLSTRTIELVFHDENQSILAQIRAACNNTELEPHLVSIAQMVAKLFFYMQQPNAVRLDEYAYSTAHEQLGQRGAKKAAKLLRQLPRLYDRVILGPAEQVQQHHGELSPHLRRGHFRLQPYGPHSSLRKVIFLAPTWIRADRLAVQN